MGLQQADSRRLPVTTGRALTDGFGSPTNKAVVRFSRAVITASIGVRGASKNEAHKTLSLLIGGAMPTVSHFVEHLDRLADPTLSEDWDNTGLLIGDPALPAEKVMTCLTLSSATVEEAINSQANLVISHHPLPFKALKRITTSAGEASRLVWELSSHKIAVYSPHTAWDSAATGINSQLAALLDLENVRPLIEHSNEEIREMGMGTGRIGDLKAPLNMEEIASLFSKQLNARCRGVQVARPILKVAFACGSAGSLLNAAIGAEADLFVTGETTFHTCLEAEAANINMLLLGHYASERFSMERLAETLSAEFDSAEVWASKNERDPVRVWEDNAS